MKSSHKSRSSVSLEIVISLTTEVPLDLLGIALTCEAGTLIIRDQQSATESVSLGSKPPPVEVVSVEEGEEVEQNAGSPSRESRSCCNSIVYS